MKSFLFIFILSSFILFNSFNLFSEDKSNPTAAWIVLEEGRVLLSKSRIGEALKLFQQALNRKRGIYPEADIAIGDVFLEEGEYDLALLHYRSAYKYRSAFTIPDEIYSLLYKMSDIYLTRKNYILMIKTLNIILKDSSFFSDPRYDKLRNSI
ncbi:MAG: tetratricopeptide repeat protein, partial [Spirochaetes bacterium]|nr:tetratricopeptide repeat protein [Spirochaetota bacterium]